MRTNTCWPRDGNQEGGWIDWKRFFVFIQFYLFNLVMWYAEMEWAHEFGKWFGPKLRSYSTLPGDNDLPGVGSLVLELLQPNRVFYCRIRLQPPPIRQVSGYLYLFWFRLRAAHLLVLQARRTYTSILQEEVNLNPPLGLQAKWAYHLLGTGQVKPKPIKLVLSVIHTRFQ